DSVRESPTAMSGFRRVLRFLDAKLCGENPGPLLRVVCWGVSLFFVGVVPIVGVVATVLYWNVPEKQIPFWAEIFKTGLFVMPWVIFIAISAALDRPRDRESTLDYWRVECDQCGAVLGKFDTKEEAEAATHASSTFNLGWGYSRSKLLCPECYAKASRMDRSGMR